MGEVWSGWGFMVLLGGPCFCAAEKLAQEQEDPSPTGCSSSHLAAAVLVGGWAVLDQAVNAVRIILGFLSSDVTVNCGLLHTTTRSITTSSLMNKGEIWTCKPENHADNKLSELGQSEHMTVNHGLQSDLVLITCD